MIVDNKIMPDNIGYPLQANLINLMVLIIVMQISILGVGVKMTLEVAVSNIAFPIVVEIDSSKLLAMTEN